MGIATMPQKLKEQALQDPGSDSEIETEITDWTDHYFLRTKAAVGPAKVRQ